MASVHKQPNGRYLVRYWTPDGRQRKRRFDKKTEADRFAVTTEADRLAAPSSTPATDELGSRPTLNRSSPLVSTFGPLPELETSRTSATM